MKLNNLIDKIDTYKYELEYTEELYNIKKKTTELKLLKKNKRILGKMCFTGLLTIPGIMMYPIINKKYKKNKLQLYEDNINFDLKYEEYFSFICHTDIKYLEYHIIELRKELYKLKKIRYQLYCFHNMKMRRK